MFGFSPQVWVCEVHPCCCVCLHTVPPHCCITVRPVDAYPVLSPTDSRVPSGGCQSSTAVNIPARAFRSTCTHTRSAHNQQGAAGLCGMSASTVADFAGGDAPTDTPSSGV